MRVSTRVVLTAVAFIACGAVVWLGLNPAADLADADVARLGNASLQAEALPATDEPPASARTAIGLPPAGTPLPALWAQLAPAARAGDAVAACRLAMETLGCEIYERGPLVSGPRENVDMRGELAALEAFIGDPLGFSNATGDESRSPSSHDAELNRRAHDQKRFCGPAVPGRQSESLAFLRQAALAGIPSAQTAYASWGGQYLGLLPGYASDPTFDRWLDEAPTVLTRMLDSGHPEAPELLADAYIDVDFAGGLFPFDLVRGTAYAQLSHRIGIDRTIATRSIPTLRARLSPAQRAEADALTERLYADHYADRPPLTALERKWPGERHLIVMLNLDVNRAARSKELCRPTPVQTNPQVP